MYSGLRGKSFLCKCNPIGRGTFIITVTLELESIFLCRFLLKIFIKVWCCKPHAGNQTCIMLTNAFEMVEIHFNMPPGGSCHARFIGYCIVSRRGCIQDLCLLLVNVLRKKISVSSNIISNISITSCLRVGLLSVHQSLSLSAPPTFCSTITTVSLS